MEEIRTYSELNDRIHGEKYLLVFLSSMECGVCHADLQTAEKLVERLTFPAISVNVAEIPEAAGQLSVFAGPTVLLFNKGREYHRQSRFIDFQVLEGRMNELSGQDAPFTC